MRVKILVMGIALTGGLSLIYGQPKYNVLKDPSFELNSDVWEEFAMPETIAIVSRHSVDPNAPDGDYVGVLSVGIGGQGTMEDPYRSGTAKLTQEFIPRIVSEFCILDKMDAYRKRWCLRLGNQNLQCPRRDPGV